MKLVPLLAAGAVAIAGIGAPAEAQRYGDRYDNGYRHDGYRDGYRGDRGYDYRDNGRYDGWHRDHGWRGHHYGRPRVTCRIVRGYYGPERRCFRAY